MEKPHNGGHDHMQVAKLVGVLAAALTSSYTLCDSLSLSPLHYLSLIDNAQGVLCVIALFPGPFPFPGFHYAILKYWEWASVGTWL